MDRLGGKKTCKYYNVCGNVENCKNCKGYQKKNKEEKRNEGKRTL